MVAMYGQTHLRKISNVLRNYRNVLPGSYKMGQQEQEVPSYFKELGWIPFVDEAKGLFI